MVYNLFGVINLTKAAIPLLRAQRAGHIIQFSSVGGRIGAMGRAPYSAAKWGVEGFSEVLQKEMAPLGVKVTIVEPGGYAWRQHVRIARRAGLADIDISAIRDDPTSPRWSATDAALLTAAEDLLRDARI